MILPRADAAFEWRDTASGAALVCRPLAALAPHVFTTSAWRLGDAGAGGDAWADVAAAIGVPLEELVRLRQVHGRAAVCADQLQGANAPGLRPEADIVVASDTAKGIAVQVADCVPVLIADRRLGVVGAAHAGWRGLALGVPGTVVDAMVRTFGSRPADLTAAIGPSVGACCYEVGPDVRQAFARGGFAARDIDRWFQDAPAHRPGNPSMPGLPAETRAGHTYFDGWASAHDQLLAAGLADDRVFTARLCTASHHEVLCSYRRDGTKTGRIAAAIRPSPAQGAGSADPAAADGRW